MSFSMKSAYLLPLLSGLAFALPRDHDQLQKRQGFLGGLVKSTVNAGYGKVPQVAGAAPIRTVLEPRAGNGAKTVKVSFVNLSSSESL
jgi:hypothetical protein